MSWIRRSASLLLMFVPMAAATPLQFSGRYIDSPGARAKLIAADRAGDLFVISSVCGSNPCLSNETATVQITKTDLSGNVLGSFSFGGSGFTLAEATAIDNDGNLVIGGSTSSPDFPLVSALQTTGGAFLTKIDPLLHGIIYSTRFGSAPALSVKISAVTVGVDGNMYFAGTTGGGLPVTPGAFQIQGSTAMSAASAFIAEISASGSTLVFATYYSGTLTSVIQGIPLYFNVFPPQTIPNAIAVDGAGNIIVAGWTSDNVPVTAGAYSSDAPKNALTDSRGFAAKFKPGGTGLVWATYLPHATVNSMALDGAGNLLVSGLATLGFATTSNALQPAFPPFPPSPGNGAAVAYSAGVLMKLASTGDTMINATYFGGNTVVGPNGLSPGISGLAMDGSGHVWITGQSSAVALPANSSVAVGPEYVAELSPDLGTLLALNSLPDGSGGNAITITSEGTVATLGSGNLLLFAKPDVGPSFLGIASSPGFQTSEAVSPGELVTVYGVGIGPAAGQVAQTGSDGVIRNSLGGAQVLFNGKPAALLYAGPTQINAIVPEAVRGTGQASVLVVTPGGTIDVVGLKVQDYAPTIFGTIGGIATPAINEDGTINGPSNPAQPGSIVAVWLTGLGSATGSDNQINIGAPRSSAAPISVLTYAQGVTGAAAQILYAGDAPAQPSGLSQINFRLLDKSWTTVPSPQSFVVQVGSVTSAPFQIY